MTKHELTVSCGIWAAFCVMSAAAPAQYDHVHPGSTKVRISNLNPEPPRRINAGARAHIKRDEENVVIVYMENCIASRDQLVATSLAARMFTSAGVQLVWRTGIRFSREVARDRPILIHCNSNTPPTDHPGALAYAFPFDGNQIAVFGDRVKMSTLRGTQIVLAHVLVHEITHILQGLARHSNVGVMKAHWTAADYSAMMWQPLPFTSDDIDLIQRGLAARAALLAQAKKPQTGGFGRADPQKLHAEPF